MAKGVKASVVGDSKVCTKCMVLKHKDAFTKGQSLLGRRTWCKECSKTTDRERTHRQGKHKPMRRSFIREDGLKLCLQCENNLPIDNFRKHTLGVGGKSPYCRECENARADPVRRRESFKRSESNRGRLWKTDQRIRMFEKRYNAVVVRDGTVTEEFINELFATEVCFYCEEIIEEDQRSSDHKTALIRGGWHAAKNLVMACRLCNSRKRDLDADAYRAYLSEHPRKI